MFATNASAKTDGPAVEVALHERPAAERPRARADAEGAGETGVLARMQEHEHDQDDREDHLESAEDRLHGREG